MLIEEKDNLLGRELFKEVLRQYGDQLPLKFAWMCRSKVLEVSDSARVRCLLYSSLISGTLHVSLSIANTHPWTDS